MVEDVSPEQIKRIAEKALVIERYILERAWGLCYAAVAAEIVLIPFLPLIILFLGLSAGYFLVVAIVVNSAVSIVGAVMVAWIFKKAYNSMLVRREIVDSHMDKIAEAFVDSISLDGLLFADSYRNFLAAPGFFGF